MPTIYLVTLHVSDKDLPVVLGAISGSAKLVSVTPTEEALEKAPIKREQYYTDGRRNKGISGEDLVLQILGTEQKFFTHRELEDAFERHTPRFSRNSVGPNISKLLTANKIRRVGNTYCLPGTVIKMGAGS